MLFVGRGAAGGCGAAAEGPGRWPVRAEQTRGGGWRGRLGPATQPRSGSWAAAAGGAAAGSRGPMGADEDELALECLWAGGMGLGYFYAYWGKKKMKGRYFLKIPKLYIRIFSN